MQDKIELLSTALLDENRELTNELKKFNYSLALASGWHYLLDWIWILRELEFVKGKKILDAGAGIGLLQWYLAQTGAEVISVDRSNRCILPYHLIQQFQVVGYTENDDLLTLSEFMNPFNRKAKLIAKIKSFLRGTVGKLRTRLLPPATGKVHLYQQDLQSLVHVPSNSIDAVVSVSALEHNKPEVMESVIHELERVLKPGGKLLVTISAARDEDWFMEPAQGWCYTELTIRKLFSLSSQAKSNYDQYDLFLDSLQNSTEMKKFMTWYYYYSPNSGMPWGIWDPKYQPVGIAKVKN